MTPEQLLPWLRLTLVPGVTPAQQHALLATFGNAAATVAEPQARVAAIIGDEAAKACDEASWALTLDHFAHEGATK